MSAHSVKKWKNFVVLTMEAAVIFIFSNLMFARGMVYMLLRLGFIL
jgi:hypothetical protein